MVKVLVAEDDKVTRLIVTSMLRSEGYEVVECGDGSSVYELALSEQADIVILDVVMPGMDGFDALRLLRGNEETRCIPAIMLTSLPDEVGEPIGNKLGVSHYLVKPLTSDMVKLSMRSVIREAGLDTAPAPVSAPPPPRAKSPAPPPVPTPPTESLTGPLDGITALDGVQALAIGNGVLAEEAPQQLPVPVDAPGVLEPLEAEDLRVDGTYQTSQTQAEAAEVRDAILSGDIMADLASLNSGGQFEDTQIETGLRRRVKRESIGIQNDMLDRKLGGGIPVGSLALIEGDSSAGKSVLCQHLIYGALLNGKEVAYFSYEETSRSLVTQMGSLGLDISEYLAAGKVNIFPLTDPSESDDPENALPAVLEALRSLADGIEVIVVDAITNVADYLNEREVIAFFSACKRLCRKGKTIVVVAHSAVFEDRLIVRVGALSDVHLRLKVEQVINKLVRSLEIRKIHNAELEADEVVAFEVRPGLGMQISPVVKSQV
jgi:flagellar protein FlaH